jgi:hypothetical protein
MMIDYKELNNYLNKNGLRKGKGRSGGGVTTINNLENRIILYKDVIKILSKKLSNYECLERVTNEKYKIRDIINLDKRIGTKSKYGLIYLSNVMGESRKFLMISKTMKNNGSNGLEVYIMRKITDEVLLKNKSKHFVFIYKSFLCQKPIYLSSKRLISVNELVSGDIKTLFEKRTILQNEILLMNLFFQTFISIATFQNLVKYVHKDTHYGNFLYQENKEVGYYHYIFKKKHYYLKSCEYNIMIYDFGFAESIDTPNKIFLYKNDIAIDYSRITSGYLNKKDGWGEYYDLPNILFNNVIITITNILESISFDNQSELFEKIIERIFIPYSPKDMFLTYRPINVINSKPFNID